MAIIVAPMIVNTPLLFLGVFTLITILGINEFHNLTAEKIYEKKTNITIKILDIIGGIAVFTSMYFSQVDSYTSKLMVTLALIYFVVRMISQLYIKTDKHVQSLATSLFGIIYIAVPIALLNFIFFKNPHILLATFIFIWVNDTGAYCVGCLFGKHRLFEKVSPKKSWEGFWGGMAFCIIAAFVLNIFDNFFPELSLPTWIGFGIIVSVFATWGDLCESLIKRTLNVKDSGNLLPGHGGILDRIDSLLIVSPAILIYFMIISLA